MFWLLHCKKLHRTNVAYGEMGLCMLRNSVVGIRDCANCLSGGFTILGDTNEVRRYLEDW